MSHNQTTFNQAAIPRTALLFSLLTGTLLAPLAGCSSSRKFFPRMGLQEVSLSEQHPVIARQTPSAPLTIAADSITAPLPVTKSQPLTESGEQASLRDPAAQPLILPASGSDDQAITQTAAVTAAAYGEPDLNETQPPPVLAQSTDIIAESETSSETPPESTFRGAMSLADFEQLALENNPTIKQLAASASKADGLRRQVGVKPNPTVGYFAQQLADEGTDQQGLFIEQEIVRGDKLALNQAVLARTGQVQRWQVEAQRFRVLTDVRLRFYEALAAQQRMQLTRDFAAVTQKAVEISEQRQQAQEGSQIEVLQAQIQRDEIDLLRQQAEFDYHGAWKDMLAITGLPHIPPAQLVDALNPATTQQDWNGLYDSLLVSSPELAAAQNQVAEASALLARQQAQPIPNLMLQLGAGYDNATDSGMLNLQVGAPLPVYNKNQGNISAAYADYCRATHEVKRIRLALKSRLARVAQEYDGARAGVIKYQTEILPKAQQTLTLSEQAFNAGELNFLQILIVRKTYFESNLQAVLALRDLAQAQAKIDGLMLSGALTEPAPLNANDELRSQSLGGQ